MENNQQKLIKILFFGDILTGKSSLIIRYFQDKFYDYPDMYSGTEFQQMLIQMGKEQIKYLIWDFHSNERFYYIRQFFYRMFSFVILCYDVNRRQTFQKAYDWYQDFKKDGQVIILALVGNKCDKQDEHRQVTYQEAQQLAESLGIAFFEVSAKTGDKVKQLFDFIITQSQTLS
ncbi:hypothetical protein ABPG74_013202 [Tetrahymena malaccensis]